MTTTELVGEAGAIATLGVLVLALTVVLLRLVALPLVVAAIALDKAAEITARPLTFTTPRAWRTRR